MMRDLVPARVAMDRGAEGSGRRLEVGSAVGDGNTSYSRFIGKRNVMIDGISIWIIRCYATNTRSDLVVEKRRR